MRSRRFDPTETHATTLDALVDILADRVAERVVEKLRAGDLSDFIDQSQSPLGRRRHIDAVRTGKLPGKQVGRRYLAQRRAVEAFMAQQAEAGVETERCMSGDEVDELAAELGFRLPTK